MDNARKKLTDSQEAFKQEQNPERFREALDAIESATNRIPTGQRGAERRQGMELWAALFAALDKHIEPKWDPKDVPETNIVPPPSGDVRFPAGVNPSAIKDPVAREEYQKKLEANRDKAERYSIQLRLRRLDERASRSAARFVGRYYDPTETELHQLETVLDKSSITERHKQLLRMVLSKR